MRITLLPDDVILVPGRETKVYGYAIPGGGHSLIYECGYHYLHSDAEMREMLSAPGCSVTRDGALIHSDRGETVGAEGS